MQYTQMMNNSKHSLIAIALLRIVVGWHFLYEGLVKVLNPEWTSRAFLLDSGGWFNGFYRYLAGNATLLNITDALNAWGLTLIGFSLVLGVWSRFAALGGMFLLALYYLSHPAFPGITYLFPSDGSYFIVNKTIVEMFALAVIYFQPTDYFIGLERLISSKKRINE